VYKGKQIGGNEKNAIGTQLGSSLRCLLCAAGEFKGKKKQQDQGSRG
jgi:hypothetical protein